MRSNILKHPAASRFLQLALAVFVFASGAGAAPEEVTDPLPLRRILLPAEKAPGELKRMRDGVLVRMSRREFENLVRQAGTRKGEKHAPRLVEAHYRASLLGDAPALSGSAEWKVLHEGKGPALLWLQEEDQPFNLAVKKPRFENRDALLAEFPDSRALPPVRSLALLVDRPGNHTVLLDWSARAESRPEGLQIDLRLPRCPAGLLEIELPSDRTLSALDGTLVSGPHDAETKDHKLWKIACGDRTHLPLLIRRGGQAEPVLLARQRTVQKLSPDGVESVSKFDLEVLHQEVRELTFECDPMLRPIEVVAPGLGVERWEVQGRLVLIHLERPLREGMVEVRCLAPLGDRAADKGGTIAWTSPAIRLQGALPRGETLELLLSPELRVASWQAGDFRLLETSSVVDPEKKGRFATTGAARGRTRSCTGLAQTRSVRQACDRRPRPAAARRTAASGGSLGACPPAGVVALGPDSMNLTVRIDYEVRQGLLFQLPLRLPPGWDVEAVQSGANLSVRNWGERTTKAGRLLLVDLHQPLRGGSSPATLTVRLRPSRDEPITGRDLPFPDVVPVEALFREGGLAIDYDELIHIARVQTNAVVGEPVGEGAWGKIAPDLYYPCKGEAVTGTLRLQPRAPRFRATALTDVFVAAGRAAVQTRLVLEGEGGTSAQVDVYRSATTHAWEWRVEPAAGPAGNRLRRVERLYYRELTAGLAGLAAASPLQALLLQAARPAGSFWRLTLERPLPLRTALTLRAMHTLEATGPEAMTRPLWEVPLTLVLGASRQDAEVKVRLAGNDLVSVTGRGFRESAAPAPASLLPSHHKRRRTYRFGDFTAQLSLQAQRCAPTRRPRPSSIMPVSRRCWRGGESPPSLPLPPAPLVAADAAGATARRRPSPGRRSQRTLAGSVVRGRAPRTACTCLAGGGGARLFHLRDPLYDAGAGRLAVVASSGGGGAGAAGGAGGVRAGAGCCRQAFCRCPIGGCADCPEARTGPSRC